jgi:hypothetical protein
MFSNRRSDPLRVYIILADWTFGFTVVNQAIIHYNHVRNKDHGKTYSEQYVKVEENVEKCIGRIMAKRKSSHEKLAEYVE